MAYWNLFYNPADNLEPTDNEQVRACAEKRFLMQMTSSCFNLLLSTRLFWNLPLNLKFDWEE